MIPASTGAAKAIHEVIPELKGRMNGTAIRVPTPNVSLIDVTVELSKPATVDSINKAFQEAANGRLQGVFDSTQTAVAEGGKLAKVFAWYDNEWGFSNRMVDVALLVGSKL
jgi:glyceraldehyde 3-phosphate dehydrogenase